jgi:orotate phosphoribosyltransferase
MVLQEKSWTETFSDMGALWIHDNNPARPHALLTSGKHSNGFFNATKVIENPALLEEACVDMWAHHADSLPGQSACDRVIGSAFGAITIAHVIAQMLNVQMGFTEPVETDDGKQMVLKRFALSEGDRVLIVEDVMTTGGTNRKTIKTIEAAGAEVLPVLPVLVNRSGMTELDGRRIIALIDHSMPMWEPEECPLCKQGSEALRPKGNWDKLNAHYQEGS